MRENIHAMLFRKRTGPPGMCNSIAARHNRLIIGRIESEVERLYHAPSEAAEYRCLGKLKFHR